MNLTNVQWEKIEDLFERPRYLDNRGPKRKPSKAIFEGVLWILRTGAQWNELPRKYGAYQTVHRRYQEWIEHGVLEIALRRIAEDMEERGKLSLNECFIDGTFASAKKGALVWVRRNEEKVAKSWLSQTRSLFQSPSMWAVLLQAKTPWWRQQLTPAIRRQLQHSLSEIRRMTPTP
jgi:transposase